MARHGENIRKRKDGRWEGRYKEQAPGKEICRYRSVYGKSYEEVREKLDRQKNLLKNTAKYSEQNQDITERLIFQEVAEGWFTEVKKEKKPSTYEKYHAIYQEYLKKEFQDFVLSDITSQSVMERISENLSDSVRKSIYCVLNQILKYAFVRYCAALPQLQRPASNVRNKPVTVLGKAELGKLFSMLNREIDIFKAAVLLCLYTGLRLGEVCSLKWSDIDFENKIITVNRTVQRLYAEGHSTKTILMETEPKSEFSRREIPISAAVMELLINFRSGGEYVFGNKRPMEPRTLQYRFKKMLKEAELSDKNFHILRHTFATNCIESNMDIKSLSEILGHASVNITLNRYVHPSMAAKRKSMEGLLEIYGQNHGIAG